MTSRKASVRFIFATIFLDALGIGLLIPVFPEVIRRFNHDPVSVNQYFGYFISVYALMQFVASPVLGSLSDRFGRRPVLLVSLLGAGLDYLLMAMAPNLGWLFAGRVIAGLTGASITVASSYMADISDDSNRSANFGLIGAAFGLGFIVGPALGGLMGGWGPMAPFFAAAFFNLLNFAFGFFVLPESLPANLRRRIDWRRMNPLGSLWKILKPGPIAGLVWTYFFLYLAGHVHPSIWTLYTENKFGWTAFEVGLSMSFVGLTTAITQGWLTRILIPKWGEPRSLFIGTVIYVGGFVCFALLPAGWMVYPLLVVTSLAGIAPPALQSMIAKDVPPQEQGELQGSLIAIASLTAVAGPIFYTQLFAVYTDPARAVHFPGVSYMAAAAISAIALLLLIFVPHRKKENPGL